MKADKFELFEKRLSQLELEVSELKKVQSGENLQQKNEQLTKAASDVYQTYIQSVIEMPNDIFVCCIDKNYRYIAFNNHYKKYIKQLIGRDIETGMNVIDVLHEHKDFHKIRSNLERALAGEEFKYNGEYVESSKRYYYEEVYRPVFDANNNVIGTTIYDTNTTEQKRSDKTWELLLRISEQVHISANLEELIKIIHIELTKLIDTTNFYVALYDDINDTYTFPYYVDQFDKLVDISPRDLKKSLTDYIRSSGVPLLISGNEHQKWVDEAHVPVIGTPSPSWLGVPLKTGGKTIGVMVVQSYTDEGVYSEKDLELMAFVSDHIATAVQRKRADEEIKNSSKRLKAAQAIAHVGNWEMDWKTRKIRASEEAFRIYGVEQLTTFTSDQVLEFVIDEDRQDLIDGIRKLNYQNRFFDAIHKLHRKNDKALVVVHLKGEMLFDKMGDPIKILGTVQDITKFHDVQEELKRAKEKAEESDKLKSAFLANMSHEIRTPMNAILGFSRLLTNSDLTVAQKEEYSEYINNSGQNLLNLINDIIDVAKIEAGQILIKKTSCQINRILNELHTTYDKQKHNLGKGHIEIKLKRDNEDLDLSIVSDPFRLRQVLANLIGNALKFIEKGYIEFGFAQKDAKTLEFFVRDTGIGIPDDKIDLIFSRFGQVQGSKIKNPGGTGLGLSISKHLVELLGGDINFESSIDKGTIFSFTHPYEPIKLVVEEQYRAEDFRSKYNMKGKRILVVEDNPINRTLLIDTLKHFDKNIIIDIAVDGRDGIEKFQNADYDIIIMDIRMPVMDGYQATEFIRNQMSEPKNKVPILGLSAHAMKEEKERSEAVGMNAFLTKPFTPEDVIGKIMELTGNQMKILTNNLPHQESQTEAYQYIDLSLLRKMYQGANDKVNNILSLCLTNIPKQLDDMLKKYEKKDWNSLRIVAHSLKSTLNYIGLADAHEIAKSIEQATAEERNLEQITSKIAKLKSIWQNATVEINEALKKK